MLTCERTVHVRLQNVGFTFPMCSRGEGQTVVTLHFHRTHTHTKPVGIGIDWHLPWPQPNLSYAQHTFAPQGKHTLTTELFVFFCCLLKNSLWSWSQYLDTHSFFSLLSPTAETCLPVNTDQPVHAQLLQYLNTKKEAFLAECFPHVWTLVHSLWAPSKPQATEIAAFPVVSLGILFSLLYRFEKTLIMTWRHFMTVCFPPSKAQGKGQAEITLWNITLSLVLTKRLTNIMEVKTETDSFWKLVYPFASLQSKKNMISMFFLSRQVCCRLGEMLKLDEWEEDSSLQPEF